MDISRQTAKIMVFGSLLIAAVIYLVLFDSLSETEMVRLSYIWLPICVSGAIAWKTGQSTLTGALLWAGKTILLLALFFELIFPML
ncbi:MAG: hypothetical protein COB90_01070 [Hyphomicrobiales bacterium]|nr:MAG: hypothetical protein COB90_01070 [Hyphomicrobiales bacterium]